MAETKYEIPTTYPEGDPAPTWTVAEFWAWDQEHFVRRHLKRTTLDQYRSSWRYWWGRALGHVRLGDLTMDMIQKTLDERVARRNPQPSTARSQLSVISAVLERARLNRAIDRNPAERIRGPRMLPTKPTALTPDELGRWLDAALLPSGRGGFVWAGVLLAVAPLTGLRMGELRGLRWANVDLWEQSEGETAGMIHVVEQIDGHMRKTEWAPPKSASSYRHVPIPAALVEVLRAHQERVERHALRQGTRKWRPHDLVFPSTLGNALSSVTMSNSRVRVARLAEIDPVPTFNCLRHTYASRLVEGGMSPAQVAKLLGHVDDQLVIRVYFDAGPVTHDAASAVVAGYLDRPREKRWT